MAEEVISEIREHPLADPARPVGLPVGADHADHADEDECRHDEAERSAEQIDHPAEKARSPGLFVAMSTAAPIRIGGASEAAVAASSEAIATNVFARWGRASR